MSQIIALTALIGALLGGYGGHYVTQAYYQEKELNELKQAQEQLKSEKKRNLGLEQKLINANEIRRIDYREVIKNVAKYIPPAQSKQSDCNITYGTLSMLDRTTHQPNAAAGAVRKGLKATTKD